MERIILTALLVGGYLALIVAANVDAPVPAQAEAAAAVATVPPSADAAERWYEAVGSVGSVGTEAQTADAAERALTSSFAVFPKPFAPR
jgi:hypothetical protein